MINYPSSLAQRARRGRDISFESASLSLSLAHTKHTLPPIERLARIKCLHEFEKRILSARERGEILKTHFKCMKCRGYFRTDERAHVNVTVFDIIFWRFNDATRFTAYISIVL